MNVLHVDVLFCAMLCQARVGALGLALPGPAWTARRRRGARMAHTIQPLGEGTWIIAPVCIPTPMHTGSRHTRYNAFPNFILLISVVSREFPVLLRFLPLCYYPRRGATATKPPAAPHYRRYCPVHQARHCRALPGWYPQKTKLDIVISGFESHRHGYETPR